MPQAFPHRREGDAAVDQLGRMAVPELVERHLHTGRAGVGDRIAIAVLLSHEHWPVRASQPGQEPLDQRDLTLIVEQHSAASGALADDGEMFIACREIEVFNVKAESFRSPQPSGVDEA
jgi:hypothetical protein